MRAPGDSPGSADASPSASAPVSADAAIRRRLRDDPPAADRLEGLRRAAYGRDGSDAPLVEVPPALRDAGHDPALPAPLVALLVEEARLVDEGRAMIAAESPRAVHPEATALHARADDDAPHALAEEDDLRARHDLLAEDDLRAASPDPLPWTRRVLRPGPLAAIAASVLVVAGLGTASAAGVFDTVGTPSPSSTAARSTPAGPVAVTDAMGTPDGRPRGSVMPDFTAQPPVHVPATEEQIAEALRVAADRDWEMYSDGIPNAVRPDVAVERIVSQADYSEQQVRCLRDSGVDASVIDGGAGISYGGSGGDLVSVYSCAVRFPTRPDDPQSDAELAYEYDYMTSWLLPCYAAEGDPYEGDVPSLEDYIAGVHAGAPWDAMPDGMDEALYARCPSTPDGRG